MSSLARLRQIAPPAFPDTISTPALVVHLPTLERNIVEMQRCVDQQQARLRPHFKTHKSVEVARRQLAAGACGLTVGTLGEAETAIEAGFDDVFIAYTLWPDAGKGDRLRSLAERARLSVGVDSVEGAENLGRAVGPSAGSIAVLVEVDSGERRTGTTPFDAPKVADAAARAGFDVVGVFTHGGHGYAAPEARQAAADDEVDVLARAADVLRVAGHDVRVVSAGSTPTVSLSHGGVVTEQRPGTYVYQDAGQVALGSARPDSVAAFVATTVVSNSVPGQYIVDAGAKALARDGAAYLPGWAWLPARPSAELFNLNDYHGFVRDPDGVPTLGSRLAVIPNHICPVVDRYDRTVVIDDGGVVDEWLVDARGRL